MVNKNELMNKHVEFSVNGSLVKLTGNTVKNYLVNGNGNVTDQEISMFINLCKYQKLNPLINEAYLVKYGTAPAQVIVSKEAFMKRANSDPHFKGFKAGILVQRGDELKKLDGAIKLPKDILIGGWAEVKRDDRDYPVSVEISLEEFGKKDKYGNAQSTWKQMPMNMIRKTAIVNALREAFPESLGAMYTEDDKMPDVQPKNINNQATETTVDKNESVEQTFDVPEETQNKADEYFDKQELETKEGDFNDSNDSSEETTSKAEQEELFKEGPGAGVHSKAE